MHRGGPRDLNSFPDLKAKELISRELRNPLILLYSMEMYSRIKQTRNGSKAGLGWGVTATVHAKGSLKANNVSVWSRGL